MKSWLSKLLFAVVGIIFMLRGGFSLFLAFWKFLLPLVLVGGGYFLTKNYFVKKQLLKAKAAQTKKSFSSHEKDVIEICPHCLQERGSCSKCRSKPKPA